MPGNDRTDETLPRKILDMAERDPNRPAMRYKVLGHYLDIPWKLMASEVRRYASALMAFDMKAGDRIALMAPNGPRWVYTDLGIMAAGGVTVPIYQTEGVENLVHVLRDSGSRLLFLASPLMARELVAHLKELPDLERIVMFDDRLDHAQFLDMAAFLASARDHHQKKLAKAMERGRGSDIATLVYTSGTTGPPKGVILTHDNILASVHSAISAFDIGPGDVCLSFLPLSHVFERVDGYYFMLLRRAVIAYAESIDTVPLNIVEVRPTVLIGVPRLFEKMFERIIETVDAGPWIKKQVFFGALKIGARYARGRQEGTAPGLCLRLAITLLRKTVFARLRERLGGRLRFFVSGGAPLLREVGEFFLAADLPIYEGYGLTETAAGISVNTEKRLRLGTVGAPLPKTRIRIAADGEILVRGPTVFQGYWNDLEKTASAFSDGWFKTGDVGRVDGEGFLTITDRKKDLIVTAGGKNIAPQLLEHRFKSDPMLSNALVYGEGKPYLTALLVPNFEVLEKFAQRHKVDFLNHCDLVTHPQILEMIRERIDELQKDLPSYSRIKRFVLISRDFSSEGDEVTPTLKLKRQNIAQNFHRILEGMYLAKDHGVHDSGFCIVREKSETDGE